MSRYTDENGEQIYPTNVIIDTNTGKQNHDISMEFLEKATDEELKTAGLRKATTEELSNLQ